MLNLPDYATATDEALIGLVLKGHNVLEYLQARHQSRLNAFLYKRLRDRSQIEDASQSIWLEVFRCAHNFKPDGTFIRWLFGIARNIAAQFFNKQRRITEMELSDSTLNRESDDRPINGYSLAAAKGAGPDLRASSNEQLDKLRRALKRLPRTQRRVLRYYFFQQLSYAEISKKTGLHRTWVGKQIRAGIEALRQKFNVALPSFPSTSPSPTRRKHRKEAASQAKPAPKVQPVGLFARIEKLVSLVSTVERTVEALTARLATASAQLEDLGRRL
jgi:RNA polymerase sigma-70 factor (ECF subfamily)